MNDSRSDSAADIPEISAIELRDELAGPTPPLLVDVRESWEVQVADLPPSGQRLIPVAALADRIEELDPEVDIVVYCRSGSRSAWAARYLREAGFEKVRSLRGGVLGWRADVDPTLQAY